MKIPHLQHIKLSPPKPREFTLEECENSINTTVNLRAVVADMQDQLVIKAIMKYSIEQGFNDLYLIDEEFIKAAIINEINRRKPHEQAVGGKSRD